MFKKLSKNERETKNTVKNIIYKFSICVHLHLRYSPHYYPCKLLQTFGSHTHPPITRKCTHIFRNNSSHGQVLEIITKSLALNHKILLKL